MTDRRSYMIVAFLHRRGQAREITPLGKIEAESFESANQKVKQMLTSAGVKPSQFLSRQPTHFGEISLHEKDRSMNIHIWPIVPAEGWMRLVTHKLNRSG